jgi:HemY protein
MWRIISFLALLALASFGLSWLLDRPGEITIHWLDHRVHTSVLVALAFLCVAAIALTVLWNVFRLFFRAPLIFSSVRGARRRRRGFDALTRGMVAAGAGDTRTARKAAAEVSRHLPREPLGLLLHAQVAQLANDRKAAEAAFTEMARRDETKLLGLRGLHIEANRRGDHEAAHHFAKEAHRLAALPWAGQAVVSHQAAQSDWAAALATVEANARAKSIDAETAQRHRAVLETALALENELNDPERALKLAQLAVRRAPDLVPAVVLAARLLTRRGSLRAASKTIERAFRDSPHPELAAAYLDLRVGDSNADRYTRAKSLARLAPNDPESRLMLARAALAARDFEGARSSMAPLISDDARPTARACLLMAEIEEAQNGESGLVRQWLARGSRAPRDAAWAADGVLSSRWAPVSPVTGELDAFRWTKPAETIGFEPEPAPAPAIVQAPEPEPEPATEPEPEPQPTLVAKPVQTSPAIDMLGAANPVVAASSAQPASARPVVFPLPSPPDDPGPEIETATRKRTF